MANLKIFFLKRKREVRTWNDTHPSSSIFHVGICDRYNVRQVCVWWFICAEYFVFLREREYYMSICSWFKSLEMRFFLKQCMKWRPNGQIMSIRDHLHSVFPDFSINYATHVTSHYLPERYTYGKTDFTGVFLVKF